MGNQHFTCERCGSPVSRKTEDVCCDCLDQERDECVESLRARVAELERERDSLGDENRLLLAEVDEWKDASGLECGGDPDGVTPNSMRRYWESVESERDSLRTENARLREALRIVWQGTEDSIEFLRNCRLQRSQQPADECGGSPDASEDPGEDRQ